jgi:hypothetical protein
MSDETHVQKGIEWAENPPKPNNGNLSAAQKAANRAEWTAYRESPDGRAERDLEGPPYRLSSTS